MFKAYENFETTMNGLNERVTSLQNEVSQKESERESAERKYLQLIEDDNNGEAIPSADSLNKAKKRIHELDGEIQTTKERVDKMIQARSKKAKELSGDVIAGWHIETASLRQELQQSFDAMLEYRAKLTLAVCEAHEIYKKADQMRQLIAEVDRLADPIGYTIRSYMGISNLVPIDNFIGENDGILPSPDEFHRVFNSGWLPDWVKHYSETGEIIKTGLIKKQKQEEWRLKQLEEQGRLQLEEDQLNEQEKIEHEIVFGRGQSK